MHINEKNILQNFKISGIFFGLVFFGGFAVKGDQKYRELAMLRDCTVCPLKHQNVVQLITDEFCHHQIQYIRINGAHGTQDKGRLTVSSSWW